MTFSVNQLYEKIKHSIPMKTHVLENVCQGYHPLRRYVYEAGDVFKSLDIGLVVIENDLLLGVVDYSIRRLIHQSQQHSNLFAI